MRQFYIGTAACGCVVAMMVDDEHTTAKDVAEFARSQQKYKRRMSHVPSIDLDAMAQTYAACGRHKVGLPK